MSKEQEDQVLEAVFDFLGPDNWTTGALATGAATDEGFVQEVPVLSAKAKRFCLVGAAQRVAVELLGLQRHATRVGAEQGWKDWMADPVYARTMVRLGRAANEQWPLDKRCDRAVFDRAVADTALFETVVDVITSFNDLTAADVDAVRRVIKDALNQEVVPL